MPCNLHKNAKTHLTFLLAKLVTKRAPARPNDSSFEEFFDHIFYLSFLVVRILVRSCQLMADSIATKFNGHGCV